MGNDNPQELLTDAESEMVSEEPPNREDYLGILDEVFDGIDAVELLADAEIDLGGVGIFAERCTEAKNGVGWSHFYGFEHGLISSM